MKLLFTSLLLLIAAPTFAEQISVDYDEARCVQDWTSMDVLVMVGEEGFRFDPSCSFTFDKHFETKSGLECKIESGMCSNFSNRGKFVVSCLDGSRISVTIPCKE